MSFSDVTNDISRALSEGKRPTELFYEYTRLQTDSDKEEFVLGILGELEVSRLRASSE